jgi:uncharacterized protein (DUF1684 family)
MKMPRRHQAWYKLKLISGISTLVSLLVVCSCTTSEKTTSSEYINEIEHWQQLRVDSLKGHTGYLNLAGLFWISDEVSSIGADSTNTFIFPQKAAKNLGKFIAKEDSIWFIQHEKGLVKLSGDIRSDTTLIFSEGSVNIKMSYGDLNWYIIKRGTDYGVRLKDYNHPLLANFNHIDTYPIDSKWKVNATWEKYATPKTVIVQNQVGMKLEQQVFGALNFELAGKSYQLEPLGSPEGDDYFILIYDETSGHETYGSGRYMYMPIANEDGETYIDFNKAFNPPCVYTEFATCIFPHEANRLPLKIEAGEKYSGEY